MQCNKPRIFVLLTLFGCVNMQGIVQEGAPENGICQSEYVEQPPDQIQCNPYVDAELRLDCTVQQIQAGAVVIPEVDWFYSITPITNEVDYYNSFQNVTRLTNSQNNILIREPQQIMINSDLRVRSRLEVNNLDELNVGQYWCRIRNRSMEQTVPSDPFLLMSPTEYVEFPLCSQRVALSKSERKCAVWNISYTSSSPTPQPTTMVPALLSTAPPSTTPPSTAPPSTTPLSTTPPSTAPPSTAPPPSTATSSPPSTAPPLSTGSLDGEGNDDVTESLSSDTTEITGQDNSLPSEEIPASSSTGTPAADEKRYLMKFYISIGALVLIIVVLLPLMIVLCIKYRRVAKGKKNMPHAQQTMTDMIIESPSIQISEYLVPTAAPTAVLSPQRERQTADKCNNPVYMTHVRQERTSFWLAQQQRRSRVSDLEHSYETTTHDYEDIFMGSFNGGNSICMNSNEAYYYINALESI